MASPPCPSNSFGYNATLCACDPGYLLNAPAKRCELFNVSGGEWVVDSSVDHYSSVFPETIFSFEPIKRFTQSQAIFVEATLVMLLTWLLFCFFLRLGPLREGRTVWFKIRWWISRLDVCFATRHWLDDQKVVKKRKTELGGTFSIASWILFIGFFAALLFQTLSKRKVEVHNVRATNGPDLASFNNDMEFNITTISSMTCSHLRDLGTLSVGNPGFFEYRVTPLSNFAKFSCRNTSHGPTIILKCSNCQLIQDITYISWKFVDLPNDPAMAVGFQFNLSAKNHASLKHSSFVSGLLKNGSNTEDKAITFRGAVPNVLKFNLFPRIYRNLHDLKLVQPLFHEFLPGSSYSEASQLQASLRSSDQGVVNVTLLVNFLSSYIVEVDRQNIVGPVNFLADLGGLFCISMGIFFYILVQCEYRIKKLRNEDSTMRRIRSRRKAREHWDKLRKYVMFTWSCNGLDDTYNGMHTGMCCNGLMIKSSHKNGSTDIKGQKNKKDTLSFNRKISPPGQKESYTSQKTDLELGQTQVAQYCASKSTSNLGQGLSCSRNEVVPGSRVFEARNNRKHDHPISSCEEDEANSQRRPAAVDYSLPPPPSLEYKSGSEMSMSDIQKNIQSLYDYNAMMRERLVATQDMLMSLTRKASEESQSKVAE